MSRWTTVLAALLMSVIIAAGCANGSNPMQPNQTDLTAGNPNHAAQSQEHLWGYYDVYIDVANQKAEAVVNRTAMFSANVVTFVNKPASNLGFAIHGTPVAANYIDVDIDVSMTHPFPGLTAYNGYDVRGIFMGTGSKSLLYKSTLTYADYVVDQAMYDFNDKATLPYTDPYGDSLVGMPDGYTRWWNATEFTAAGVLGYTQGKLATPKYQTSLNATLNPYKYFADGLTPTDDVWTWLTTQTNADKFGVFTAGSTNTRNYYLRFPTPLPNVKYGYAIVANWKGELPEDHPSNAPEAIAVTTNITPDIYFVDNTNKGGSFKLDVSVYNWSTVMMESMNIWLDSNVMTSAYQFTGTQMDPIGGGVNYSTYHGEVAADNVTGLTGNEYWVIVEQPTQSYKNDYNVPNGAGDDLLAAFFRYDLYVSPTAYCTGPTLDSILPTTGSQGQMVTVTLTGAFTDGSMLGATLKMAGETDIVGINPTYIDANNFSVDFNLTGAELGLWDIVATHDECDKTATLATAFEVVMPAFDIHYFDTSPIGAGITPAPANSGMNTAIDVACRPNDGAFYVAWSNTTATTIGYVDRYNAGGTTTLMSAICDAAGADTLYFKYGLCSLDAGTVNSRNGWGFAVDPVVHFGNDETNTDGANDSYGFWYGSPLWFTAGACNAGNGNVYTYAAFNYYGTHYRINWEHNYNNSWNNAASNYGLQTPATDFDGMETYPQGTWDQKVVRALSMGTDQNSMFFGLFKDAPHVRQYNSWLWSGYGAASFGVEGTGDGEIHTARDMTFRMSGNRMYILDEPTDGQFRVQCLDMAGNFLATSGPQMCSTYGATHPYKIDYNDFNDCIYLLLDNNKIIGLTDDSI